MLKDRTLLTAYFYLNNGTHAVQINHYTCITRIWFSAVRRWDRRRGRPAQEVLQSVFLSPGLAGQFAATWTTRVMRGRIERNPKVALLECRILEYVCNCVQDAVAACRGLGEWWPTIPRQVQTCLEDVGARIPIKVSLFRCLRLMW
jgi:hypothetical protein